MHLRVRQVVALVVVQREAQAALILAEVVAHEVRVLRQVDGLQRQPPQPLPPVDRLWVCGAQGHPAATTVGTRTNPQRLVLLLFYELQTVHCALGPGPSGPCLVHTDGGR